MLPDGGRAPRRRRVLEVEAAPNAYDWLVRGPGVGQAVVKVTGRAPHYSPTRRGYSVQKKTALDVVALCERLSYDVVITGPRTETSTKVGVPVVDDSSLEVPQDALW